MPHAVPKRRPFTSLGIPSHKLTRQVSGVCQLFPKTGSGDLTPITAPLQGSWQAVTHCQATRSPALSPVPHPAPSLLTLLPSRLLQNPEQPLAKSLPNGKS